MIASLGMYDRPETAQANDRLWSAIRAILADGPKSLTRDRDLWDIWRDPDLLFAQTCGMPFRTQLHDITDLIGTPDYGLPGCPPGYYRSAIIVHADDPAQTLTEIAPRRLAYNEPLSQSGWAALANHAAPLGLSFGHKTQTGAHRASAEAVANGIADFAAIDALSWILINRYDRFASALRVLEWTAPTPALPYITARGRDVKSLFAAAQSAIQSLDQSDRDCLHLKGLVAIPTSDYRAVPTPKAP